MSDTPIIPAGDDDLLAAEVALGLLEGEDRVAARARLLQDRDFSRSVADWQERFVAMTDDIAPVAPPAKLRRTLMSRLFAARQVPLMQRLWLWQVISVAALATVAFLALPVLREAPVQSPGEVYATRMAAEDSALELLAVMDMSRGDIALRRVSGTAPEGRVLELWAILPDRAPISLGVLPEGEVNRVVLPADLAPEAAQITLAITDEPPGGAPDGAPTGTIMAAGTVAEL
ncbi:MAG: anti-sigma factor [Sulfitobacter sp.]|uniref:anti-sigma factor n=1 Tax=Sulfitobacter sp. OXR-159 TaxID=3100174 RepID=UPI002AC922E3|nr:anti-sigma factor [Sulfitobacter sp. OXR-159]WPZ30201.1 anti-sigma factor [Sulfitobacter sp. OXR-159]